MPKKKPNYILLFFVLVIVIIVGLLLFGSGEVSDKEDNDALTVVTTIFPLADIARQIAGPDVEIIQLIPSGASPHSFTLTPQQISSLTRADVMFVIGHGLDDFAVNSALKIKNIPTVLASDNIELSKFNNQDGENDKGQALTIDPHYWLSVPNAQIIAQTIANVLVKADPGNKDMFNDNLKNYQIELEGLEKELQQSAKGAEQKSFIAIHDAWSYFAEQYGFNLVAVYEPTEGKQPSIKDIQRLGQIISANKITSFFTEPQKQSDASARLMSEEFGLVIKVLDPLGGVDGSDSYIQMMKQNMKMITDTEHDT